MLIDFLQRLYVSISSIPQDFLRRFKKQKGEFKTKRRRKQTSKGERVAENGQKCINPEPSDCANAETRLELKLETRFQQWCSVNRASSGEGTCSGHTNTQLSAHECGCLDIVRATAQHLISYHLYFFCKKVKEWADCVLMRDCKAYRFQSSVWVDISETASHTCQWHTEHTLR